MAVTQPREDRPRARRGAHAPRARGPQRAHAALGGDVRARAALAERRRRLLLPAARPVADLPRLRARAPRSPTSTATATGTSTTASARWCRATPTRRSRPRCASASGSARTSPRSPRTRSSSPRSSRGASGWRAGASSTPARRRRWTRSGSRARSPGATRSMKIFGSYHGHHDGVMVSIGVPYDEIGDRENLASLPYGAGIPKAVVRPHDPGSVQRRRRDGAPHRAADRGGPPAGLRDHGGGDDEPRRRAARAGLPRGRSARSPTRHGIVLIFDEVKTGLAIAAGGATERFGVQPDMVTLAKTLGGGLPSGAIGGTEEVMSVVEDGSVYQVGTYNGNPLSMAAARASLEQVLTPDAYRHLDALNDRIVAGCEAVIERHRLPGYAVGIGSKGCVTFSPTPIVDYETFKANQDVARDRARVAVEHEPRDLHDARAARRSGRCRSRTPTRRSTPTCTRSTRWRRRSPPSLATGDSITAWRSRRTATGTTGAARGVARSRSSAAASAASARPCCCGARATRT